MSDFLDIFAEVLRIMTVQPREARMRYRLPEWEERMQEPERNKASEVGERFARPRPPRSLSDALAGDRAELQRQSAPPRSPRWPTKDEGYDGYSGNFISVRMISEFFRLPFRTETACQTVRNFRSNSATSPQGRNSLCLLPEHLPNTLNATGPRNCGACTALGIYAIVCLLVPSTWTLAATHVDLNAIQAGGIRSINCPRYPRNGAMENNSHCSSREQSRTRHDRLWRRRKPLGAVCSARAALIIAAA